MAEWQESGSRFVMYSSVYVDGEFGSAVSAARNAIFLRELP